MNFMAKYYEYVVKPVVSFLNELDENKEYVIVMPQWFYEYYISYYNEKRATPTLRIQKILRYEKKPNEYIVFTLQDGIFRQKQLISPSELP